MKSLKKVFILIFAIAMIAVVFTVPAYACSTAGTAVSTSSRGEDIRYAIAESIADSANETIEMLVYQAQRNPFSSIDRLVRNTERISRNAINVIRALGFDAECTYETYVIHGVEVEIDPIIIIKRGTPLGG